MKKRIKVTLNWNASDLSFDYPVHDRLHGFRLVTLYDSFEVLRAMLEGLCHCDVQVVVSLLSSQILHTNSKIPP